jgi:hypothetical protein
LVKGVPRDFELLLCNWDCNYLLPSLGVPMSAKSDLFENAFSDPTPTQPN